MLGRLAPVMAMVSPSQLRPAVSHTTCTASIDGGVIGDTSLIGSPSADAAGAAQANEPRQGTDPNPAAGSAAVGVLRHASALPRNRACCQEQAHILSWSWQTVCGVNLAAAAAPPE